MKIENSNVMMKSEHKSYTHTESHSMSVIMRSDEAATLEFSDEAGSYVEQMKEKQQEAKNALREQVQERNKQNAKNLAMAMAETEKAKQQRRQDLRFVRLRQVKKLPSYSF